MLLEWENDIDGKIVHYATGHGILIDKEKEKELIEFYKKKVINFLCTGKIGNMLECNEMYANLDVLVFERLADTKNDVEKALSISESTIRQIAEKIRQAHGANKTNKGVVKNDKKK